MYFAKLTHILPLKNAWGCSHKELFLLSPSPPSSVDSVPRALTRVVVLMSFVILIKAVAVLM